MMILPKGNYLFSQWEDSPIFTVATQWVGVRTLPVLTCFFVNVFLYLISLFFFLLYTRLTVWVWFGILDIFIFGVLLSYVFHDHQNPAINPKHKKTYWHLENNIQTYYINILYIKIKKSKVYFSSFPWIFKNKSYTIDVRLNKRSKTFWILRIRIKKKWLKICF